MKYELIRSNIDGLFRVRALRDFSDVHIGDIGGMVESSDNLSQGGDCWVYDCASVLGAARVRGDAVVTGRATVRGSARISGRATVADYAIVKDNAHVGENAYVVEWAIIEECAHIGRNAVIRGFSRIGGDEIVMNADWR